MATALPAGEMPRCNPHHLGEHELAIEFEIRGIQGRQPGAVSLLAIEMLEEESGRAERPHQTHRFTDEASELAACRELAGDLLSSMRSVADSPSWGVADIVRSRLIHLGNRVERFVHAHPRNVSGLQLMKEVEGLVTDGSRLREFLASRLGPPSRGSSGAVPKVSQSVATGPSSGLVSTFDQPPPGHVMSAPQLQLRHTNVALPGVRPGSETPLAPPPLAAPPQLAPPLQQHPRPQPPPQTLPLQQAPLLFQQPQPVQPQPQQQQQPLRGFSFSSVAASEAPQFQIQPSLDRLFAPDRNAFPFERAFEPQPPLRMMRSDQTERDGGRRPASLTMGRWSVKFAGSSRDLAADEFMFRVEDMAMSSGIHNDDMVGAFHVLLSDRAEEWFWGFRRKQRDATWRQFRVAFVSKFGSRDTDAEILSAMSQRMQRAGERFDDFSRAVEAMSFRLRVRLPEAHLMRLLTDNADPQLRKILQLHDVRTVDELQETCTGYEDLWIRQGSWRRASRHVSELDAQIGLPQEKQEAASVAISQQQPQTQGPQAQHSYAPVTQAHQSFVPALQVQQPYVPVLQAHQPHMPVPSAQHMTSMPQQLTAVAHPQYVQQLFFEPDQQQIGYPAVDALQLQPGRAVYRCYNCDEEGHTYHDCQVATRNVFCYGCGAKGIYRPQCQRCAVNSKRRGAHGPSHSANPFHGPVQQAQSLPQSQPSQGPQPQN